MTEEIWSVLETMNDYEKLYLTYLIQDLKLTKLDFIHKGLLMMYNVEALKTMKCYLLFGLTKQKQLLPNNQI